MEIALKIADKIRANERFAVYIVIPMWPEGVPTGAATQRILYWQVIVVNMSLFKTLTFALLVHVTILISCGQIIIKVETSEYILIVHVLKLVCSVAWD